jgi:hypothetical protein
MAEDQYIKEKLVWITQRLANLDEVDKKLNEMNRMAEYARDNELGEIEKAELNRKINQLGEDVQVLYEKDKMFCLEWQ